MKNLNPLKNTEPIKRRALKDWEKFEGWESPAWYNVRYTNRKNGEEIILSNSGKNEGSNVGNDEWTMGIYDSGGNPKSQKKFNSKALAVVNARQYMRKH